MPVYYADFPFLSTILGCCILGVLVMLALPDGKPTLIKGTAALFSGATLLLSLYLFITFDRSTGGLQFVEKRPWVDALGISYFNGVDGFGLPNILLTGIVFFTGVLTMWELKTRVKEFFALYFVLVTGVFGLFMSMDLFFIFLWFDVSLFPMYLLIAVWGTTRKEYAAMKLTLYLLAGSALILPALLYIAAGQNSFDLLVLMKPGTLTFAQQKFAFPFLFVGFGILAAVWPFHTWSPVGHVAAPHGVSMLHAGVLMKIGAFGILRVAISLCPEGWRYWAPAMSILAVVGIVYGALAGLRQTDLKYVIGYSSVSHMGIVGLGLSTVTAEGLNGAVFQMFAHGIMTALFFSSVGFIYDRTHTKVISELGGLARTFPIASTYFILAGLAGMGLPLLAPFWGEVIVFLSAFRTYPVRGIIALSAMVISALFMLRVIQKTCYGPENPRYAGIKDLSFGLGLPRLILAGVLLLMGLAPSLLLNVIETASGALMGGLS